MSSSPSHSSSPLRPPSSSSSTSHRTCLQAEHDKEHQTTEVAEQPELQCSSFFAHSPDAALARRLYLRTFIGGSFAAVILIFVVFSLFWGSLWHIPSHALDGWVVNFDGGVVGDTVVRALLSTNRIPGAQVSWSLVSASFFPLGEVQVADAVRQEHTWVAITINSDASERLRRSLSTPNATYDGTDAMSVFAVEARNEYAYRNILSPYMQPTLDTIVREYAMQTASENITSLDVLTISPQTVVLPISYRFVNLIPFSIPVASAVTFVGLILQLILTFFVVMMGASARTISGLDRSLSTRSLIVLRMMSAITAFFVISLFFCLLSVAFQLPTDRKFGQSGFLVLWMLSWAGMLSVGLALESLVVLLTVRFIPFFMLTWVIVNISVTTYPIEVLPHIFRYGYASPFYNLSRAMRTVIFGTKNRVGFDFGILIVWILVSCATLPLLQWWVRRPSPQPQSISTVPAPPTTSRGYLRA